MPSICNHLELPIPADVQRELDGVPFIGEADLADLKAEKREGTIVLHWKNLSKDKTGKAEIYVTTTNKFKDGGVDEYQKAGEAILQEENFTFKPAVKSVFYKVAVKGPHQFVNTWIVN